MKDKFNKYNSVDDKKVDKEKLKEALKNKGKNQIVRK